MRNILLSLVLIPLSMAAAGTAAAQGSAPSAEELVRLGEAATRELRPAEALQHFEAALALDSTNAAALWTASMNAVDLGEFEKDKKKREALYRKGELYARRALALQPASAEPRFHLARALGMVALSVGVRERVKFAKEIRELCLEALRLDPHHAGALHVLGVWNAEVMRLSGIERTLAKAFLGAGFFAQANWDDATRFLEQSVEAEPSRIVHNLDLARVYRDRKMPDKARTAYQKVISAPPLFVNDLEYKKLASEEMAKLKG